MGDKLAASCRQSGGTKLPPDTPPNEMYVCTRAAKREMTVEFLIQAIVHQTTILIAQLATLGGGRAPLAQLANQVFLELVRELERQGVSRKVSADMFGLGLRTYRRKIQRLSESATERGRSLWEVVLEYVRMKEGTTRADLLLRFSLDDEAQVRAVLHDLCDSGLVVSSGDGSSSSYRAPSDEELAALRNTRSSEGQDDFLVALMYREGLLSISEIAQRAQLEVGRIEQAVLKLAEMGRIRKVEGGDEIRYEASSLLIPLGAPAGWEAAVLDHFKAVTKTIILRLSQRSSSIDDSIGGSTYTFDVWPGHPLENEVRGALKQVRSQLSSLRERVADYNEAAKPPDQSSRVVLYVGQCLIEDEREELNEAPNDQH